MHLFDQLEPRLARRRILVVEDDGDIAHLLVLALGRDGFEAASVASVAGAAAWLERFGLPSLAIVDIHLPDGSGLDFCQAVQRTADLPIILLTGEADSAVKTNAIRSFAEDYVVKPFDLGELLARVQRVLRRMVHADTEPVASDLGNAVQINFLTRTASTMDRSVELTPIESKLLHVLLAHEGTTVPSRFLIQRIWPQQETLEETLRVHMSRLRRKLHALCPETEFIETERMVGYRIVRPTRDGGAVHL